MKEVQNKSLGLPGRAPSVLMFHHLDVVSIFKVAPRSKMAVGEAPVVTSISKHVVGKMERTKARYMSAVVPFSRSFPEVPPNNFLI